MNRTAYQNCPTAAPVVAQSVTVVRPNRSFDCSGVIYTITKVVAVIIISCFGGVLLITGISLYSADDFFETGSIITMAFGVGLISIAIFICIKSKNCSNSPGRVIQSSGAPAHVVAQPVPGAVQYPGQPVGALTPGYVAVTSHTYTPMVAGQGATTAYTPAGGKGPLPAYPGSAAGAYPTGPYPPGDAYPPGQHPPGLYSPGVPTAGAYQPGPPAGAYQPGAPPAGAYQPEAPPAYQPGASPAGAYQPGASPAGAYQPGAPLNAPEYQPPPPFAPTEKPPPYSY
ncbi:basic proline-rich protein-like isoform X2 [Penaeus japonicus]|uniref:basic proline-rich protein-like isoform X2 n=1 Tax=Penaeus japonicus TaxID=27405 RepID=UPI001C714C01|nr:basic proline-rich protein-like isoform X2 [Penaeus japonicus]